MDTPHLPAKRRRKVWLTRDSGDFEVFLKQVSRGAVGADWPHAAAIERNVLIYDGDTVGDASRNSDTRQALMAEWVEAFDSGPGIIVIRNAIADHDVIDRATEIFDAIIEKQRADNSGGGDHFAKPGANDRIWNALQKHCLADPANFARYYACDAIAMAAEAWLGRGYQMTAQVNRVNPGGAAQTAHRDYHLGFMSPEQMEAFPGHVHKLSPVLTLQGAIAHCDMPVESGPTMVLPFSQAFPEGYLAFGRPEFQAHFAEHHVQLPLKKGDAMFFNPALMHGAGTNRSPTIHRMANLLQVSSAFGRAMESIDRVAMVTALYPEILKAHENQALTPAEIDNAIAAAAEGYAFPTNLDSDPPIGGLAPKTQAEIMIAALDKGLDPNRFARMVAECAERQKA